MNKKMFLILLLLLHATSAYAAQQPVTVGTEAEKADIDTNFANTHANFTELYAADITSGSCVSNVIVLTKADTSTITTTIPCDSDVNIDIVEDSLVVSYAGATDSIPLSSFGGGVTSYNDLTDKPTIPTVDDTAYNSTSWDGNTDAPTKNAVRDKIETLSISAGATIDDTGGDGDTTVVWSADKSQEVADSKQDAFTGQEITSTGLAVVTAATEAAAQQAISVEPGVDVATQNHNHDGVYEPADADLTAIAALNCSDGQVAKKVSGVWTCAADNNDGGTGAVATTVPTYSDEACSPGNYAYSSSPLRKYECFASGDWNYFDSTGLVDWDNPTTYTLTLSITGDGQITVGSTDYTSTSSPHSITGLSGSTSLTASYPGSNDTLAWSGTDSADVSGSTPNYAITMDEDKSISADFSGPSSAALSYVGSASDSNASSTDISITHGLTINSGDLVLAIVNTNSDSPTISDNNSGTEFTLADDDIANSARRAIFYRIAGASEPASYNFTLSSAQRNIAAVLVFSPASGAVATSPFDVAPSTVNAATSGDTITANSITITEDDSIQLVIGYIDGTGGFTSFNGSGFTEAVTATGSQGIAVYYKTASAGATSSETFTLDTSCSWFSEQISISPSE